MRELHLLTGYVHHCKHILTVREVFHQIYVLGNDSPQKETVNLWGIMVTSQQFVRFPQQIAGTHLYSWVERGTVRVKCLAQEHNTVSPARARTRTARSVDERTNHEATAPPTGE